MTSNPPVTLSRSTRENAPQSLRLAAIDVGSNSIHMIVAQIDPDGGVTTLWRMKEPVGLGRMTFPSKKLSRQAMDVAISVLDRFQQQAIQHQSEKVIAIATSAIREAENGGDLIERARQELGLRIKVVSAREEARLIYLAVRHALPLRHENDLIIDIGGGSVEFIVGDEIKAALLESRKLGASRMTATFVKSDPITKVDRLTLLAHYDEQLTPLSHTILALRPTKAFGTSGTLENIAAMCASASTHDGAGNGAAIEKDALFQLVDELLKTRSKDRAKMRGLDDGRKDQIIAGALLVRELFQRLNLKRIQICPAALREGILLDYLSRHLPDLAIRREVPDPRRRSVIDLARRCHWNRTHAEHVAALCLELFDELKPLHGLGNAERELIEYGALLHDIGWHIGRSGHHKHSMYLVLHGDLKNFTAQEIATIANIARYHRTNRPKLKHKNYRELSPTARRTVDVGAALLQLADGLDRSHASVITGVRCKTAGKHVQCALRARSDAELEIWGARRKVKWFKQVFNRRIEFDFEKSTAAKH